MILTNRETRLGRAAVEGMVLLSAYSILFTSLWTYSNGCLHHRNPIVSRMAFLFSLVSVWHGPIAQARSSFLEMKKKAALPEETAYRFAELTRLVLLRVLAVCLQRARLFGAPKCDSNISWFAFSVSETRQKPTLDTVVSSVCAISILRNAVTLRRHCIYWG